MVVSKASSLLRGGEDGGQRETAAADNDLGAGHAFGSIKPSLMAHS